jgi:dolichyldiphosphatase
MRNTFASSMPSTHSAAISFLATYIILASLYLPLHPSFSSENVRLSPLITTPWAIAVVMSRVWLGHHTWPQVFAGASYGLILASVLFGLWRGGLSEYAERVAVFGLS